MNETLMTDYRRAKYILLAACCVFCFLLAIINYVSTLQRDNIYISQFILQKPEISLENDTEKTVPLSTEGNINISTNNNALVNISIVNIEKEIEVFKVDYGSSTQTAKKRKYTFSELKNIKKSENNIFFIETRCATEKMANLFKRYKGMVLNARQCCSIESTALTNLDRDVYLFHSCLLGDDFLEHSPRYVAELLKYPNVHVVRLNITEVLMGSPIQELHQKKLLEKSKFPVEHTSDVLRLALLWRFGGTYCDLDVVTIRSLHGLGSNWAGLQDGATIANGVINFQPDGVGHELLRQALDHVNSHYDPTNWATNGPLLITPIILRECNVSSAIAAKDHCQGNFTVLDTPILYPVYYPSYGKFFDESAGKSVVADVKKRSYSVHIWNKMSHGSEVRVSSDQAYGLLAEEFCPLVYWNCGSKF